MRFFGFLSLFIGSSSVLALLRAHNWFELSGFSVFYGAAFTFLAWCLYVFNTFVDYRARTHNALKSIDIELKQRRELLPRLEEVVRAAAAHEAELLPLLTELRALANQKEIQEHLNNIPVGSPTAIVLLEERYPDLKADQQFEKLMDILKLTEEKICHARNFYNENVVEYNTLCLTFPYSLFAALGRFEPLPFYQIERNVEEESSQEL